MNQLMLKMLYSLIIFNYKTPNSKASVTNFTGRLIQYFYMSKKLSF